MQGEEQAEGPSRQEPEQDVYGGGAGPTGMTNKGEGDGDSQLTVTELVALREACAGEATNECCNNDGDDN